MFAPCRVSIPWRRASRSGIGDVEGRCARRSGAFQLLRLIGGYERFDDFVQPAVHYPVELMHVQPDAVVGDAILREIVGSNLFAAVAGTDHRAPLFGDLLLLLLELHFVESRAQHAQSLGAVLDLRFFILAGDDRAGRQMSDTDCRISGVYGLAARAGGAERVDTDVLGIDFDLDFVRLGQHRHGDGGGVNAAGLLRGWYPLHAVYPAFVLQFAVNFALNEGDNFLESAQPGFQALRSCRHSDRAAIAKLADPLRLPQSAFVVAPSPLARAPSGLHRKPNRQASTWPQPDSFRDLSNCGIFPQLRAGRRAPWRFSDKETDPPAYGRHQAAP